MPLLRFFLWFLFGGFISSSVAQTPKVSNGFLIIDSSLIIENYYSRNWQNCLRNTTRDSADFIGLPHPYSTPTLAGELLFQEMYYWDSYFINRGLLAGSKITGDSAMFQQALNNCNNLIFLVDKLGFVPNANRFIMTNRSQPPVLSLMVMDIFYITGDTAWLRQSLAAVSKEHSWWMKNRQSPLPTKLTSHITIHAPQDPNGNCLSGLNHYGHNADSLFLIRFGKFLTNRLGDSFALAYAKNLDLSSQLLAEAESGWDFTNRFNANCLHTAAIDLNCLLYQTEINLSKGYKILKSTKLSNQWDQIADHRKRMIYNYMHDKHTGWYWDLNLKTGAFVLQPNAAQFLPYFVGIPKHNRVSQQCILKMSTITHWGGQGVFSTVPILGNTIKDPSSKVTWNTQWSGNNAWPCMSYFAIRGLRQYSTNSNSTIRNCASAMISAYLASVEDGFNKTGRCWEKYTATKQGEVNNEYEMPAFMGWTTGVYMDLKWNP